MIIFDLINRVGKIPDGMAAIRTRELPVLTKREKMDILKITSKILSASVYNFKFNLYFSPQFH